MALQYYDLVLLGIAGSVVLGRLIGAFTAVGIVPAVIGTSALAAGLMAHAMFVRGPVDGVGDLTEEVERVGPVEFSN
ncbi:hypothetical protein [Halalkalicoccus jeotgali]|uniref:Uncharacterized protein n=1 Tax=Halalkalicoccus jeotgali (strain DSM 18796 / CECT 7217 / JCM 14584 / KCTC 4019 / B3) TaxID=795797 RepID=D8JAC9_HALJB|nr:hypothetical protein [Halalkalicoccus jeotgali]ADJ14651.1 hypothetical protein HacjB3_06300 [Halalkalicoccus jeotgali B3]ELY39549.1 hypothetical protein C497_04697 [Halalkalicoccus jeotgali B3]